MLSNFPKPYENHMVKLENEDKKILFQKYFTFTFLYVVLDVYHANN